MRFVDQRVGSRLVCFFFGRKADHTMGLIGFLKAQLGIPKDGVKPVRTVASTRAPMSSLANHLEPFYRTGT